METVRKNKVASELEDNQPVIATEVEGETVINATEQLTPQETQPQQAQPQPQRQTIQQLLSEAPELYNWNPTAQQIEDFRRKELAWRAKLNQQ